MAPHPGPEHVVLETDRLLLRRLTMDDLDALAALYRAPEVRRWFPDGHPAPEQTREELAWIIDVHHVRSGYGLWATVLKGNGAFIGRCGLLPWEIAGRTEVEVAYLLDRAHWGRGLATEAAWAIVEHAFATLPVDRLICLVDPGNEASRRVATRIGMTLLGTTTSTRRGRRTCTSCRGRRRAPADGPPGTRRSRAWLIRRTRATG